MKLIDYEKYKTKWSPRSTILLAVFEALVTGLFLGVSFMEAIRGRNFWIWAFPLVLGFSSGVGTLQATLIALHNSTATSVKVS